MKKRQSYHRFTRGERRFIRRWYPHAMTQCIAHLLGLTTRQVENYIGRHAGEPWTRKTREALSAVNSRNIQQRHRAKSP